MMFLWILRISFSIKEYGGRVVFAHPLQLPFQVLLRIRVRNIFKIDFIWAEYLDTFSILCYFIGFSIVLDPSYSWVVRESYLEVLEVMESDSMLILLCLCIMDF